MESGGSRRNSWIACPNCGHKVARVRTCDIAFKCKHCGYEFEVIIGPVLPEVPPYPPASSERKPSSSTSS
jgi:hypothetical protein